MTMLTAHRPDAALEWPAGRVRFLSPLIVLLSGATAILAMVGDGNAAVVAPAAAVLLIAGILALPLRIPLFGLMFLALSLDTRADAGGHWVSPVASLGSLLFENLNKSVPLASLSFPLSGALLVMLVVVHIHRVVSGSRIDGGVVATAHPMIWALALSTGTIFALVGFGMARGGDLQMAKNQVQNAVLLLVTAYLCAKAFRGWPDYRMMARLVTVAACIKAAMAIWVSTMVLPPEVKALDGHFATTHGDSLLFAAAMAICLARFTEQSLRRNWIYALVLPILIAGMVANNRRLVWVELCGALLVLYFISTRRLRRTLTRGVIIAILPVSIYIGAGWNSSSRLFSPVKMFRSVEDSDVDSSTLFRDIENYNLLFTIRSNSALGSGFGHPFDSPVKNYDISFFKEYYFMPHNSVLGLWAFGGVFGFSGLSLVFLVGAFLAARSYRLAKRPEDRMAAFAVLAMIVSYQIQSWGDLGFNEQKAILLVGPALGIAGQLAISTGAWHGLKPVAAGAPIRT
jgi:hypothetical protein